jgi:methylamine dehydrogenase accessory protein MauD
MIEALLVSTVLLWLAVLGLGAVVLALLRQVGVLHERIAPAGALVGREGPRVGEPAPRLELDDWTGTPRTVGGPDPGGKSTLLFFLSPTCPVCKTLLPVLESVLAAEGAWLRLVLASDGPRAEHEAFVAAHRLARFPYLLSTELGLAYQVSKLPYAVVIDAGGIVRARGLVNSREHLESLFEAKERGVESVQQYLTREARTAPDAVAPEAGAWR